MVSAIIIITIIIMWVIEICSTFDGEDAECDLLGCDVV
jgi:hypothetical protein